MSPLPLEETFKCPQSRELVQHAQDTYAGHARLEGATASAVGLKGALLPDSCPETARATGQGWDAIPEGGLHESNTLQHTTVGRTRFLSVTRHIPN